MKLASLLIAAATSALSAQALAQAAASYPTKPVRYIVPYAPGGPTDIVGRVIAQKLSEKWGQQVVVDNRPGANANIGAEIASKAAPDGYTLFQGTGSTHGSNPALYPKLAYDPLRDFVPVVPVAESTLYLAVSNKTPVNSVKELIAYAKSNPGKLNYGSVGSGSAHHLTGELLRLRTGIDIVHVPFKGSAPARAALAAGEIDILFDSGLGQDAKAGRAKVLAVTSRKRWEPSPEVPTMIEAGVPDFESRGWFAIFAPTGTPTAVVEKINRDANEVMKDPDVRTKLNGIGQQPTGGSAEALAASVRSELTYWAAVVKASGAKVE